MASTCPDLLLAHNTSHHFEVALALNATLREHFTVWIWSTSLHRRGRAEALQACGIKVHVEGQSYAAMIVLTEEADGLNDGIPTMLKRIPAVWMAHRAITQGERSVVSLSPFYTPRMTLCDLGLRETVLQVGWQENMFVVQGNMEPRRDYSLLAKVAQQMPDLTFRVVGASVPDYKSLPNLFPNNVQVLADLDELAFYNRCSEARFLLPMVDPVSFPQYFKDRFTSSVLTGLGLRRLFVAHEQLFALYPIRGVAYREVSELPDAMLQAARMPAAEFAALQAEQDREVKALSRTNAETMLAVLSTC